MDLENQTKGISEQEIKLEDEDSLSFTNSAIRTNSYGSNENEKKYPLKSNLDRYFDYLLGNTDTVKTECKDIDKSAKEKDLNSTRVTINKSQKGILVGKKKPMTASFEELFKYVLGYTDEFDKKRPSVAITDNNNNNGKRLSPSIEELEDLLTPLHSASSFRNSNNSITKANQLISESTSCNEKISETDYQTIEMDVPSLESPKDIEKYISNGLFKENFNWVQNKPNYMIDRNMNNEGTKNNFQVKQNTSQYGNCNVEKLHINIHKQIQDTNVVNINRNDLQLLEPMQITTKYMMKDFNFKVPENTVSISKTSSIDTIRKRFTRSQDQSAQSLKLVKNSSSISKSKKTIESKTKFKTIVPLAKASYQNENNKLFQSFKSYNNKDLGNQSVPSSSTNLFSRKNTPNSKGETVDISEDKSYEIKSDNICNKLNQNLLTQKDYHKQKNIRDNKKNNLKHIKSYEKTEKSNIDNNLNKSLDNSKLKRKKSQKGILVGKKKSTTASFDQLLDYLLGVTDKLDRNNRSSEVNIIANNSQSNLSEELEKLLTPQTSQSFSQNSNDFKIHNKEQLISRQFDVKKLQIHKQTNKNEENTENMSANNLSNRLNNRNVIKKGTDNTQTNISSKAQIFGKNIANQKLTKNIQITNPASPNSNQNYHLLQCNKINSQNGNSRNVSLQTTTNSFKLKDYRIPHLLTLNRSSRNIETINSNKNGLLNMAEIPETKNQTIDKKIMGSETVIFESKRKTLRNITQRTRSQTIKSNNVKKTTCKSKLNSNLKTTMKQVVLPQITSEYQNSLNDLVRDSHSANSREANTSNFSTKTFSNDDSRSVDLPFERFLLNKKFKNPHTDSSKLFKSPANIVDITNINEISRNKKLNNLKINNSYNFERNGYDLRSQTNEFGLSNIEKKLFNADLGSLSKHTSSIISKTREYDSNISNQSQNSFQISETSFEIDNFIHSSQLTRKTNLAKVEWQHIENHIGSSNCMKNILKVGNFLPNQNCKLTKMRYHDIATIGNTQWLQAQMERTIIPRCKLAKSDIFILHFQTCETLEQAFTQKRQKGMRIFRVSTTERLNNSFINLESDNESCVSSVVLSQYDRTLRSQIQQYCESQSFIGDDAAYENYNKNIVKSRIEEVLVKVFNAFEANTVPCFKIRHRKAQNCTMRDDMLQFKPITETSMLTINYNHKSSQFKFCLIIYLMAKCYILLENNTKLTRREIFYQNKHILKKQQQLNAAIEDLTCLLNVGPWDLHIMTNSGLIFGDLIITYSSGAKLDCNLNEGVLIPNNINDIVELRSKAYFILVVEKESIFQKLIQENLSNKLSRSFVMITGKGYPSMGCQRFLKKLWRIMNIPIFILVDADAHGIRIMLNYKYGSMNNPHLSQELAVPKAKWLGILPSEILTLDIKSIKLSQTDKTMINNLIKSPYVSVNPKIKNELEVLLKYNRKASIEGLIKINNYLSNSYLPTKLFGRSFI